MDYEKAYKDALERARNIRFGDPNSATANVVCEEIFPELAVSEDERIRQEILEYIDKATGCKEWVAWLEKQGETFTKRDVDDAYLKGICDAKRELEKQGEKQPADSYCQDNCKGFQETNKCFADGVCKAKREAEQNPAWSEEDENRFNNLIRLVENSKHGDATKQGFITFINKFKPFKPQWKPTDEQLDGLVYAIDTVFNFQIKDALQSLYNDLKKS